MIKIAIVVNLAADQDKNREALRMLDHMQGRHPEVKLSRLWHDCSALIEVVGEQETPARDAAAEVKRGLKINDCSIWHEQVIRGQYAAY